MVCSLQRLESLRNDANFNLKYLSNSVWVMNPTHRRRKDYDVTKLRTLTTYGVYDGERL